MPRTSHVTTKKPARNAEKVIGSNAGKRWRKITRRDQPSKSHHAGCPGCEYCNNIVRNAARAAGFADEWGQADEIECDFDESINYPDDIWEIDDPYELYPFYWADTRYFETEDCWRLYYREGGRWGWNYLPPTARELAMDLASLDELNDTFIPTYPKEMVNTTTNKSTRRPQAPKDKRISRDRAAKKRAAFVAMLNHRMITDADGNVRLNSHPREEIHFMTHLRHVRAERLAQAKADMARHTFKESLSEADLDELDDDWDDELDEPLFDEEEIDADELDDLFANWDADLEEMFPEDLQPVDDHDPVYGDRLLNTDEFVDHGAYGTYRGVHTLQQGFGLDSVFGEGYLGGNCGFSVRTRP